jgi:hypothetical protein
MPNYQEDPVNSTAKGTAISGISQTWVGLYAETSGTENGPAAVWADGKEGATGVKGHANGQGIPGVAGYSLAKTGSGGPGVYGESMRDRGVVGVGGSAGVAGHSDAGSGVTAESNQNVALIATTRGRDVSALIVNQWGTGNIMIGRNAENAEVFRVLNSGDVQVRGVTLASDKSTKTNFSNVDTGQILDRLVRMPVQNWNYKTDSSNVRHIGPTSQDFRTAFGLNGDDEAHISSIDAQGIALAAIKGLNDRLSNEVTRLQTLVAGLEARLAELGTSTGSKADSSRA